MQYDSDIVSQIIKKIQLQTERKEPFSSNFFDVKRELRMRRKLFLGSDVPLRGLVTEKDCINENAVTELSRFLSEKSVAFWDNASPDAKEFFLRFYQLTIYALCGNMSGNNSCIDDILLTAECLALTKDAFIEYMKAFLPKDWIGELFDFAETYDDSMFSVRFVDAVLGAVCILLGVTKEPLIIPKQTVNISKEAIARARSQAKK